MLYVLESEHLITWMLILDQLFSVVFGTAKCEGVQYVLIACVHKYNIFSLKPQIFAI